MADQNTQLLARLAQLAALTDAVTRLRENQDRAAQAAAARRAAEQLRLTAAQRATAAPGAGRRPPRHPQPSTRCLLRPRPTRTRSGSGIARQPPRTPPVDPACAALLAVPAKVAATELYPDATRGRRCGSRKPLVMRVSAWAG